MQKRVDFQNSSEWAGLRKSAQALGVEIEIKDGGLIVIFKRHDDGNGETMHAFEPMWDKFDKSVWVPMLLKHVNACANHKLKIKV